MWKLCLVFVALVTQDCSSQEEDGPYRGSFIGKLNSYHHQVSGEVYAVDDWTVLLVNFNYDGTGDDTFFWAGDAARPGPQGFIVPDEHGKTNILERYYNGEVRLTLPEGKRVSRIKWLAVYDIDSQNTFGDVYVPDEFEAPAPRALPALAGTPAVSSQPVRFLTASTFLIPEFRYDGSGEEVYFWAGVGPQPSAKGFKIPDEYGYLESIRAYRGEDVTLELPAGRTVFDINWLSVWDARAGRSLAAALVSEGLNVPPADRALHDYKSALPACLQLHRDYQVSWEVFGPQVTFELAAMIESDEYMSFGISGSESRSSMLGADVAVAYYNDKERRGVAVDYNITAQAACVQVLGRWEGVCRDSVLGGQDSNQVFTARRENGLTVVSYRRQLQPTEPGDREWPTDRAVHVVWAVGRRDADGEPSFHRLYHKRDLSIHLARQPLPQECAPFTVGSRSAPGAWETPQLFDPSLRVFRFALGPAGGARGTAARGEPAGRGAGDAALAWYVNGQLAPDLQLRRGLLYSFKRPALGGGVPPAGGDGGAARRARAALGGGAARGARAGRRARDAARAARAHRGRRAVPRAAPRRRRPAPRRRLPHLPRLQQHAAVGVRRRARRPRRRAQLLLARPRVLPLLHARRYGRAHLRSGPTQAKPRARALCRRAGYRAARRAASPRPRRRAARRALAPRVCNTSSAAGPATGPLAGPALLALAAALLAASSSCIQH